LHRAKKRFPLSKTSPNPLDLYSHLPFRIAVLSNLLRVDRDPHVRRLTALGARELRILLNVGSYMPVKAADIAYQSRLDTHTVSRGIRTLLDSGLALLADDLTDRRSQLVSLTETGMELYSALVTVLERRSQRLAECLSEAEQVAIGELLSRLEMRAEEVLAEEVLEQPGAPDDLLADQKELLRWYRRSEQL
jgi:DNA-binding MarR family transcriptional regulator